MTKMQIRVNFCARGVGAVPPPSRPFEYLVSQSQIPSSTLARHEHGGRGGAVQPLKGHESFYLKHLAFRTVHRLLF